MTRDSQKRDPVGEIAAIRGNVVDVRLPPPLPPRYRQLLAGTDGRVVLEVHSHLNRETVRCIALTATRGLGGGSTFEMSSDLQKRLIDSIHEQLSPNLDAEFSQDGDLLCGIVLECQGRQQPQPGPGKRLVPNFSSLDLRHILLRRCNGCCCRLKLGIQPIIR